MKFWVLPLFIICAAILSSTSCAYSFEPRMFTPLDSVKSNDSTRIADSIKFEFNVRRTVINTLHELGIKTAEDSAEKYESNDTVEQNANPAPADTSHHHWRKYHYNEFYGKSPQQYDEWQPFSDFRYNRVDGLFLGLGSSTPQNFPVYSKDTNANSRNNQYPERAWRTTGGFGYAFASHFWTIELGLSHLWYFGDRSYNQQKPFAFELGAEGHIRTDTRDAWLVNTGENTATSLIAREDYQDYFKRLGYSSSGTLYLGNEQLSAQYRFSEHDQSLIEHDLFTFFGGNRVFRQNPGVNQDVMNAAVFTSYYDSKPDERNRGWKFLLQAEYGTTNDKYGRYIFDLRRYQPVTSWMEINLRARLAGATGNIPAQDSFYVGGISTLPAYDYKEFMGNRAVLLNLEWGFGSGAFDWALDRSMIFLLADAGYAYTYTATNAITDGWNGVAIPNMKTDLGICYGTSNGGFRIGAVWRNDIGKAALLLRFSRPF